MAVTRLLSRIREGDASASVEIPRIVYAELRGVARAIFAGRRGGHTLQPTALVHECWLKLDANLDPVEGRPTPSSSRARRCAE